MKLQKHYNLRLFNLECMLMKILLDTNTIEEKTFDLFKQNNIFDLVKRNKMNFYSSDVLLGERFYNLYQYDTDLYKKLLDLTLLYTDERIFAPIGDILKKELHPKFKKSKYWFIPISKANEFKNKLLTSDIHIRTIQRFSNNYNKQKTNYSMYKQLIEDRKINSSRLKDISRVDLQNFIKRFVSDFFIDETLKKIILEDIHRISDKQEQLNRLFHYNCSISLSVVLEAPLNNFKFDNTYFELFLKTLTYPIDNPNSPYDKNFNDNSYLCYMKDLDILISNDTRYLKSCFKYIYRNTNKKIMTVEKFIEYIGQNEFGI